MNYKNILQSIGFIVGGLLLFYFSFKQYKKLKGKFYKPNKEEAKEWPYIDNMEEVNDYSMKISHIEGLFISLIVFLVGIYLMYQELKFLFR